MNADTTQAFKGTTFGRTSMLRMVMNHWRQIRHVRVDLAEKFQQQ